MKDESTDFTDYPDFRCAALNALAGNPWNPRNPMIFWPDESRRARSSAAQSA